jgi:hypothetical protein
MAQNNMSRGTDQRLIGLAVVLIAIAVIVGIWYFVSLKNSSQSVKVVDPYVQGFETARQMAYKSGLPNMPISSLSGVITEVSGSSIKIKTNLFVDERVDGVGQVRTINIGSDAKVLLKTPRDEREFQKEQESFNEAMRSRTEGIEGSLPKLPERYESKDIKISDLKVGDHVTVQVAMPAGSEEQGRDAGTDLRVMDPIHASIVSTVAVQPEEIAPPAEEAVETPKTPEVPVVE